MANTVVYIRDAKTGQLWPIRAVDNGDGTYSAGPLPLIQTEETDG